MTQLESNTKVKVGGRLYDGFEIRADEVVVGDVMARLKDNVVTDVVRPNPDPKKGLHQRVWLEFGDAGGWSYYPFDKVRLLRRAAWL